MTHHDNSTQSGVHAGILRLAVPSIVTNITTPLLALMDVAVAGHMGAPVFIAAIAVGGSMFNMLYWLFAFLRMGSSGLTAQAYGARNMSETVVILHRALLVAISVGVAMVALQRPICDLLLGIMDPDTATAALTRRYFYTLVWGAPAFLSTFALTGWFLGMQDSRITMWVSLLINVTNIVASLVAVYILRLGVEGIAAGTLLAQWVGFAVLLSRALRVTRHISTEGTRLLDAAQLRRFFSLNVDIFLRTLCLVSITMWFTRVGASQGDTMLAANALLTQFFTLFSYFMDGFAFAGEALTGRYVGAADRTMLRRSIRALLHWGMGVAGLFTLLYVVGGDEMLRLLSSEPAVVTIAADYLPWVATIPAAGFLAFTWDGIFIGATATRSMLLSMAVATVAFFAIQAIATPLLGNHGLWLAFITYLLIRGLVLTLVSHRQITA